MNSRPNIVYIFVDDMVYGDASCLMIPGTHFQLRRTS